MSTVLFPGAGSFGSELGGLGGRLVRYPGRQGRTFGVPAESFGALVRACAEQVPAGSVLVGHSFGAYVAYATAAVPGVEPVALVVVGADAPGLHAVPVAATASPAAAAAYLDQVDPNALAGAPSDEWREVVAETAMQDLRLLRELSPGARLGCPVHAARGAADPLTTDAGIAAWADATTGPCTARLFPGGHSDLLRTPGFPAWLQGLAVAVPEGIGS